MTKNYWSIPLYVQMPETKIWSLILKFPSNAKTKDHFYYKFKPKCVYMYIMVNDYQLHNLYDHSLPLFKKNHREDNLSNLPFF